VVNSQGRTQITNIATDTMQCNAKTYNFSKICAQDERLCKSTLRDLQALLGFVEDSGAHCLPVELSAGYNQNRLNNNRTVND
jgi:hypothetical protein